MERVGEAEPVGGDHVVGPGAELRRGSCRTQVAVGAIPGVHAVLATEIADRLDALFARTTQGERRGVAEATTELADVAPPAVHEPTVATRRPTATDVLLQQDHVEVRLALLQVICAPHPGVSASEDDDV